MATTHHFLPFAVLILLYSLPTVTGDRLIDPRTILPPGKCNSNSCWHNDRPPDDICPVDLSQCSTNSSSCGMYHSDCYCKLKTGLRCAWSCDWLNWMKVEDWFFKNCPDAPTIEFNKAPACVAGCLAAKLVDYGCLTKNTNCFCIHGSLFNCQQNCGTQDKGKLKSWLIDSCNATAVEAESGIVSGNFARKEMGIESEAKGPIFIPTEDKKLNWYEIMAITLLLISITTAGIFWGWTKLTAREYTKIARFHNMGAD